MTSRLGELYAGRIDGGGWQWREGGSEEGEGLSCIQLVCILDIVASSFQYVWVMCACLGGVLHVQSCSLL